MIISRRTFLLFFIITIAYCGNNSFAQTFQIDTASFFEPTDYFIGPEPYYLDNEPSIVSNERVSHEMMFVPADILYKNMWDTLNIRIGRTDWSKISDSSILFMHNINEDSFVFPFKGKLISPYGPRGGRFHAGVDIKLDRGDSVVSAFDGKVRIARTISGYGKIVVVRHNNGLETTYGHLSKFCVKVNDEVKAGQLLGLGGRTGRASTEHLHFETRILGEHFNPNKIIDFEHYCLKHDHLAMDKTLLGFGGKSSSLIVNDSSDTGSQYVKIKSGDTLYALALKHKTTVKNICKLNGIKETKILSVGSRLRVK